MADVSKRNSFAEYDVEEMAENFAKLPSTGIHDIIPQFIMRYVSERKRQCNERRGEDSKFDFMIDVGCGNGKSTRSFAPYFKSVMGCDISKEQIKKANQFQAPKNVIYQVANGESIPASDGSADLITICLAVQDMDIEQFFKECKRIIKPSGVVAVYGAMPKDILLINPPTQTNAKLTSAMNIFMSSYLTPMLKYFKDNDIPEWHVLDRYTKIFDSENQFKKFRRDDLESPVNLTLSKFIQNLDYIPAWKKFNERFEGRMRANRQLEQELKQFWNVSDLDSGNINVKVVRGIFLLIFSC